MAYLSGFGNQFSSESLADALPKEQNSPQKPAYGLYAEQLSGSAFTMPRQRNLHTWLYRIRPSVLHHPFVRVTQPALQSTAFDDENATPNQLRWDPLPYPATKTDFIQGLITFAGHGSINQQHGAAIHHYAITQSMQDCYFYNADGEMLIVPQEGGLIIQTELGILIVEPTEIACIPRGMKFAVALQDDKARGYICENYGTPFHLPELGLIGANGLAAPRHFLTPVANYEDKQGDFKLFCKFQNKLWQAEIKHSPFDVVAWQGNYVPYKYDLKLFNTIYTVSFDHPDPSIFTVLTSPSPTPGIANVDFVIFPHRWLVAEHTFRPPYYHRNIMSEYMGLIHGSYDAKETGFVPGGSSLHNCMSAHGPDKNAVIKAREAHLKPVFYQDSLAIMFESRYPWIPTQYALNTELLQKNYFACWQDVPIYFDSNI